MTQEINRIKFINIESIYSVISNNHPDKEQEINNTIGNMETSQEFRKLFFFCDEDYNTYYYQKSDEQKIKNFLNQHFNVLKLKDYHFYDYGSFLREVYSGGYVKLGKLNIEYYDVYKMLNENCLNDPIVIERLIDMGKKFLEGIENLKKECIKTLMEQEIMKIKMASDTV